MPSDILTRYRREIIRREFSGLNERQLEAVTTTEGPVLILAGAGSGKTTVIINRIHCLLKFGRAYSSDSVNTGFCADPEEKMKRYLDGDSSLYSDIYSMLSVDVPEPWQILAITFTNKAANEIKERLLSVVGEASNGVWAGTFHSCCVRILRRYAERLGYTNHFTIYDTDDSKRVIKECQRLLGIDDKKLPGKSVLSEISRAKDSLISPEEYLQTAGQDARRAEIGKLYKKYSEILLSADAMDFDDIIVNTVKLLRTEKDALEYYSNKFRYIMVDEYQDTNHAQYVLVSLLAGGHNNLCVVGDDDQSIYSFRGANIENILSFERQFKNSLVVRLEENYRSTGTILDTANAVISNNSERKGKNLWTSNEKGAPVALYTAADDTAEAEYIASEIRKKSQDREYSDFAVLYRMNSQSAPIEKSLVRSGIPYKIIGAHRFYDRKEIKDAVAYLALVSNHSDDVRLMRIINEPKRGIGEATVNKVAEIASIVGESMFEVMRRADEYAALSKARAKLKLFTQMIEYFDSAAENGSLAELLRCVINESGYGNSLKDDPESYEDRMDNLNELYNTIARYEAENPDSATLEGFLEEVTLQSDIDGYDENAHCVVLMTLHSAKGLEFPCVFIPGMEEGIFPSERAKQEPGGIEEERRLAYVGITRAKKELTLLNARVRMQFGKTASNPPSVFISEIPVSLTEDKSPNYGRSYGSFSPSYQYGRTARASCSTNDSLYGYDTPSTQTSYSAGKYGDSFGSAPARENKKNDAGPAIKPGDTVCHKTFGRGIVISCEKLGNDELMTIDFEGKGQKKIMRRFAGITLASD